jgi:phage tail-like protein
MLEPPLPAFGFLVTLDPADAYLPPAQAALVSLVALGQFSHASGLGGSLEVMPYPEGGRNDFVHKLPTRIKYPNIVLKRGVTHEDALLKWFWDSRNSVQRKEMTITLLGPGTKTVRTWAFLNAYPIKWTGPNLNASSNQIATESLEVVHNGLKGL